MGLFDEFYYKEGVECPCEKKHYEFQSKDLDCVLDWFHVLEDGTLEVEDYRLVIDPQKRNDFGFPLMIKHSLGFKKLNLTDTLNLYSTCLCGKHWIDIILTYVDGQLINKKIKITENE